MKKFTYTVENIFLPIADTCLKLSMQKMFLFSNCNSWKSQTGIIKNERTRVFWDLKKVKT